MAEKFGFGIIGAGVISAYHAEAIKANPDAEIRAVADPVPGRAAEFAAKHGGRGFEDFKEMVRQPDVDCVCVCTPSGLHAEHALAAMEAGKHVIVEKPMAIRLEDGARLLKTAREKGVTLAVVSQLRTTEPIQRLKKAIADGAFGKIVNVDVLIKYWRNQAYYDSANWRGTWAMDGGGATMNQGCHGIDEMHFLVGPVESVYARCATVAHNIEVEDLAVALLTFKSGALGHVLASTVTNPGTGNRIEVNGTQGTAVLDDKGIQSWCVAPSKEELASETIDAAAAAGKNVAGGSAVTGFDATGHTLQIANFIAGIRGEAPLICSGQDGFEDILLILSLYESSRQRKEIVLADMVKGLEM
ncbi:MAG: Gfo/Idh/MocA family oxidoreductase [Candidatus Sumerlaeia bacterium]